jgi:hypothetical protein
MSERRFVLDTNQHRDNAARYVGRLPVEDGAMELIVRPYTPQRTTSQNARLWLLHTKAAAVTGYSAEEMHELMLCKFFGTREIECGGITRTIPLKRSSARNKREFGEFMEQVEAFYISELGVWLE